MVAPLVGAWIETQLEYIINKQYNVAPLVGAWIETLQVHQLPSRSIMSHPSWVRGLKQRRLEGQGYQKSRTPRGCVD